MWLERSERHTGVILAGGQSRRMGEDKALLKFQEHSFALMLFHMLQTLFPTTLLSISRHSPSACRGLGIPVVEDVYPDHGPLSGIHGALCRISTPYLFAVPCDMPLITAEMVRYVMRGGPPAKIVIAGDTPQEYPLFGIYPRSVFPHLDLFLKQGRRKVFDFLREEGYTVVDLSRFRQRLRNINTPEDYRALLQT